MRRSLPWPVPSIRQGGTAQCARSAHAQYFGHGPRVHLRSHSSGMVYRIIIPYKMQSATLTAEGTSFYTVRSEGAWARRRAPPCSFPMDYDSARPYFSSLGTSPRVLRKVFSNQYSTRSRSMTDTPAQSNFVSRLPTWRQNMR